MDAAVKSQFPVRPYGQKAGLRQLSQFLELRTMVNVNVCHPRQKRHPNRTFPCVFRSFPLLFQSQKTMTANDGKGGIVVIIIVLSLVYCCVFPSLFRWINSRNARRRIADDSQRSVVMM
jgi:hypothetical protein